MFSNNGKTKILLKKRRIKRFNPLPQIGRQAIEKPKKLKKAM